MKRSATIIAALSIVTLLPTVLSAVTPQQPAVAAPVVGITRVKEQEDMESRRYTGLIVSPAVVELVPRVSGEILEVGFQDGAVVQKGQMLYRLDDTQYRAAVKNAEAQIAECQARLKYAENNYERNHSLFEKKAVSRDTMENTLSSLESCRAELLAAEAGLITARDNLKNTVISAPHEGVVGVSNFTVGNYLTPSSGVLVSIIRVQPIRVRFSISIADYLSIFGSPQALKADGVVRLRLSDNSDYPVDGTVELINNEANERTDAIQVYASFLNADYKLIVGSTVGVTISRKKGIHRPAVPSSAVMHDNSGSYVYVLDKTNRAEKRVVIPGNTTGGQQLILSGVDVGEVVVSQGTHKVIPGGIVEPVDEQER